MDPLKLIADRLDRIENKVDKIHEDHATKKGAMYVVSSIVAALISFAVHIFTVYKN